MRRQPYPITNLTGGINVNADALFLTDNQSPNLQHVRFHKGILKKDFGYAAFDDDTPDAERPMLIDNYYQFDGDEYLMMATLDDLHYLNSGSWTALGSTPEFTGDADNLFFSTVFNDLFIITNGKDSIHKWNGTTMTDLGGLSGKTARNLIPFFSVLVLGYTTESGSDYPYRVRWSDTGDPETYTGGNSGYIDMLDTPDFIQNMVTLGDRLFIFRERSIYELVYVGSTGNAFFEARLVVKGVGTYAPKSCIDLGEHIIFFGSDNIYLFDGLNIEPVGDPLFPWLYETDETIINHNKLNRSVALYEEETSNYLLALPKIGSDDPNLLLKYNTKTGVITKQNKSICAMGYESASSPISWASATGNWEDAAWNIPWKRRDLPEGAPVTLYAAPDGTIEQEDRTQYSSSLMYWQSKDFVFAQSQRWEFCELWVQGQEFSFEYSTDQGQSWSPAVNYTPQSIYTMEKMRIPCEVTSDRIRFRIKTTNERFELKTLVPWYIPRKRAKEYT